MAEIPAPENKPAVIVNRIIEGIIFDVALRQAKVLAVAQAPYLGWPVISQVFDHILGKIGTLIYEALARSATFAIIDSQVESQKEAYEGAVEELKRAIDTGSDADEAKKKFKETFEKLIRFDGIAPIGRV